MLLSLTCLIQRTMFSFASVYLDLLKSVRSCVTETIWPRLAEDDIL